MLLLVVSGLAPGGHLCIHLSLQQLLKIYRYETLLIVLLSILLINQFFILIIKLTLLEKTIPECPFLTP